MSQAGLSLCTVCGLFEGEGVEERKRMMPVLIERVDMTEIERGFCQLVFQREILRSRDSATSRNVVVNYLMGAAGELIAINPPLLTTHTFPPVELDYDIIRPKRAVKRDQVQESVRAVTEGYS